MQTFLRIVAAFTERLARASARIRYTTMGNPESGSDERRRSHRFDDQERAPNRFAITIGAFYSRVSSRHATSARVFLVENLGFSRWIVDRWEQEKRSAQECARGNGAAPRHCAKKFHLPGTDSRGRHGAMDEMLTRRETIDYSCWDRNRQVGREMVSLYPGPDYDALLSRDAARNAFIPRVEDTRWKKREEKSPRKQRANRN